MKKEKTGHSESQPNRQARSQAARDQPPHRHERMARRGNNKNIGITLIIQ